MRILLFPFRVLAWVILAALLLAGLSLNVVLGLVIWPAALLYRVAERAHDELRERYPTPCSN